MKICVYGAGAIGSYLASALDKAGEDVSLIARGATLEALRNDGLRMETKEGTSLHKLTATDSPKELGQQDYVIVALKAHQAPPEASRIAMLCGTETAVVPAVNGIPWWYFHALSGPQAETPIESVDPGAALWRLIGPRRAIGCVVYPACEMVSPGHVRLVEDGRFTLGEPGGQLTDRVQKLAEAMRKGGLKVPVKADIRNEIWLKLWGNVTFNPISALTLATLRDICQFEPTRALARAMMLEAQQVAEHYGARFPIDVDRRIEGAEAVGAHKTSMLQDLEQGRPLEIDALVGSVQELARSAGIATPIIDGIAALLRLRVKAPAIGDG